MDALQALLSAIHGRSFELYKTGKNDAFEGKMFKVINITLFTLYLSFNLQSKTVDIKTGQAIVIFALQIEWLEVVVALPAAARLLL